MPSRAHAVEKDFGYICTWRAFSLETVYLRGTQRALQPFKYCDNPLLKQVLPLPSGICHRQQGKGQTATRALLSLQISWEEISLIVRLWSLRAFAALWLLSHAFSSGTWRNKLVICCVMLLLSCPAAFREQGVGSSKHACLLPRGGCGRALSMWESAGKTCAIHSCLMYSSNSH